jgi:hypothetical protein
VGDGDSILEELLAAPGLYAGSGTDVGADATDHHWVARIQVAVLPSRSAVSLDYEARSPENPRQHSEHTVVGRGTDGVAMVMAHSQGGVLTVLHESEPGRFTDTTNSSPFPVEIRIDMSEPGLLIHEWWFGPPGHRPVRRDVARLELLDRPAAPPSG